MTGVAQDISTLCQGKPDKLEGWLKGGQGKLLFSVGCILVCGAVYGSTLGILRSPHQALFAAVKFPVMIFATVVCNALVNGMLAMVMGIRLRLDESFHAILMSYAIACLFLASLGPVFFFHLWNWIPGDGSTGNGFFYWKLSHIGLIAIAGFVGNVRLWKLLESVAGSAKAWAVQMAWLVANIFLGCQLSWILRPFFGNPNIPVAFLREDALERSFYEDVLVTLLGLWNQ